MSIGKNMVEVGVGVDMMGVVGVVIVEMGVGIIGSAIVMGIRNVGFTIIIDIGIIELVVITTRPRSRKRCRLAQISLTRLK